MFTDRVYFLSFTGVGRDGWRRTEIEGGWSGVAERTGEAEGTSEGREIVFAYLSICGGGRRTVQVHVNKEINLLQANRQRGYLRA